MHRSGILVLRTVLSRNEPDVDQSRTIDHLVSVVLQALSANDKYRNISRYEYGPLEINAFSITFWVTLYGSDGPSSLYVKIPKIIFYDKAIDFKSPLTNTDKVLAGDEYKSLQYLSDHWDSSLGVEFVKPLCYIEEYNAIITPCIENDFFFQQYRQSDLSRIPKDNGSEDPIVLGMWKLGASLDAFHSQVAVESSFTGREVLPKFKSYTEYLASRNVSEQYLREVLSTISEYREFQCPSMIVNNLKGIDIRQILVSGSNTLYIIDPGKMSRGYREVDIARFLVTCRILYWGTFRVPFKTIPDQSYEEEFLRGYSEAGEYSVKMLNILVIKELFKQWKMGHTSLAVRKWPRVVKYLVKKIYIDPFYKWMITKEVEKFEA